MQTRTQSDTAEVVVKSGGINDACARYGLGKASMRKLAEDAKAIIRIGKRLLVNYAKVDAYLDEISGRE